jgi:hypothetical protein
MKAQSGSNQETSSCTAAAAAAVPASFWRDRNCCRTDSNDFCTIWKHPPKQSRVLRRVLEYVDSILLLLRSDGIETAVEPTWMISVPSNGNGKMMHWSGHGQSWLCNVRRRWCSFLYDCWLLGELMPEVKILEESIPPLHAARPRVTDLPSKTRHPLLPVLFSHTNRTPHNIHGHIFW